MTNETGTVLDRQAARSQQVRKAVYAELKERREILIDRKYKQGRSMLAVATEVALLTDVEVLEELNYEKEEASK